MTNDTRAHSYLASFGSTINQFELLLTATCLDYDRRYTRSCLVFRSKIKRHAFSRFFKHPQVRLSRSIFSVLKKYYRYIVNFLRPYPHSQFRRRSKIAIRTQCRAMLDNRRVRRENVRRGARKGSVSYGGVGTTKGNAMRSAARNATRIKVRGQRSGDGGSRAKDEGMVQGEPTEKNTPANKSQTLAHTRVPRAAPGNFSMAPAELEFSLIFTFSRRPPRGSAIVRTASLGTPTTITEKMQRSEPEVYLPTNLPTNQPNGAKSCR